MLTKSGPKLLDRILVLLRDGDKAATTTTLQVLLNWQQGLAR